MKKKNIALRLAVLTLVVTMITMSLVSGTYSKYVTTATGSDTARVAKFAFNLKDGSNTLSQSTTTGNYNIFNYADTGVYSGTTTDGKKIIAPGTAGTLNLEIDNLSEVKVTPTFVVTQTNTGSIPVYYTIGSGTQRYSSVLSGDTYNTSDTYQDMSAFQTALNTAFGTMNSSNGSNAVTASKAINWTWAYSPAGAHQTDGTDTSLGIGGSAVVTLQIATTVTQSDT